MLVAFLIAASVAFTEVLEPGIAQSVNRVAPATLGKVDTSSNSLCVPFEKRIPFERQTLPAAMKPAMPKGARTRLVQALSDSDTLIVYELGHPNGDNLEPYEPDTRLLIVRHGNAVNYFALKDLKMPKGDARDWGASAVAMDAVQLCSNGAPLIYLVTQAGNQGGYYFALQPVGERYRLIPISGADQGRLVLFANAPGKVEVWDAAETGACTACPKPFFVEAMQFDGERFRLTSKRKTTRQYSGFQDQELLIRH
jgi:hypothetical protein